MRLVYAFLLALLLAACGGGDPVAKVALGDSPARGQADAWVTMVEFSDFQCPYCAKAEPTVQQLAADYPDDLRVVYKHFPLSFHERALPAAHAAECAREQGKFWEMHDKLFAQSPALADSDLASDATQLSLDLSAWNACLPEQRIADRIDADFQQGKQVGVSGTPTFFINGRALVGSLPYADFKKVIDEELDKARKSGIAKADYYRKAVLGEK